MKKIYMTSQPTQIFDEKYPLPNISFINHVADEPNWLAGPVRHENWCEVVYINRGKAYYKIDHRAYTVTAGDVVIFNQNMIHEAHSDAADPVERWACGFTDLHMAGRRPNCIISDGISPVITVGEQGAHLNSLFQMIMDAVSAPSENSYNICQHAICTILSYIDDIIRELPTTLFQSQKESLAHEIISYIDNHYMEPLSLRVLSREFFISPDYLSHIVKKKYGISPIEYLINRRIGESIRLLMSTTFNINTIAEMVGYPNINHFSTAFKKKVGISPSKFRKNLYVNSTPKKRQTPGRFAPFQ